MHEPISECPAGTRRPAGLVRCAAGLLVAALALSAPGGARAAATGTPAAAWDDFREGEKRSRSGDLTGALESFRTARASLETSLPVDRSLADALALDLYNLASSFSTAKDAASSLACFEQLFLMRKGVGPLRDAAFETTVRAGAESIADWAVSTGNAGLALPVYRARVEAEPASVPARLKLASALLQLGRFDAVREAVQDIRKLSPRSVETWDLAARVDLAESDRMMDRGSQREARLRLEWALGDLDEAFKLDPNRPQRLRDYASTAGALADLLEEEGDFTGSDAARARSIGAADEALKLGGAAGALRLERALRLAAWDRPADALDEFARAAEALAREGAGEPAGAARGGVARTLVRMALDAMNEERWGDAEAALSRARKDDPRSAPDVEAASRALAERRARVEAIVAAAEKAGAAEPGRGDAHLALADLYFDRGRYDDAEAEIFKASRSDTARPKDAALTLRRHWLRPGLPEPARRLEIEVAGGRVPLVFATEEGLADVRKLFPEAWRRVAAVLGTLPGGEPPVLKVYGNRRAFRAAGFPRTPAWSAVAWHRGVIGVYAEPGRDAGAWARVLGRGIALWAVDRLSRGRAPIWLAEGVASASVAGDRDLGAAAAPPVTAASWIAVRDLDAAIRDGWNDTERCPPLQDESGALADALAAPDRGADSLRRFVDAMAAGRGVGPEKALSQALRLDFAGLDRLGRGVLAARPPK
ncbi:MAG: tetratricopeptide repeat protein [Acidobacteria bacterium]|nr:tetratricopeptide repeat protein [Acidobacteriota bacterium]